MTTPAASGRSGPGARGGVGTADPAVFPPTLREVMLRPRWIGVLAFALVVAGVFAWLGQWQLARAIDTDPLPEGVTEQVRPISDVLAPGAYLSEPLVGQRVEVSGSWVPGDFLVVASRFNDGVEGFWVTGQFRVADTVDPTSVAVAVGWAPTRAAAESAAAALNEQAAADAPVSLTGRLISDEGPLPPPRGEPATTMIRMSPAALLSQWHDTAGLEVYRPYLVAQSAPEGLVDIVARAPEAASPVNWLNLFYAAEWAVFAGFAFYFWYRLAKDAWEKEVEEIEDAAAEASGKGGDSAAGKPAPAED